MAAHFSARLLALQQTFHSGQTRPWQFRKQQLEKLRKSILDNEEAIYTALNADLRKSREEVWVTEIGIVLAEIRNALSNLRRWMEPERVATNLVNLPSQSWIEREPLGVVLIIAPWNYPFQLLFNPLVGAIAAGNCVVVKPSEAAPAMESLVKKIIGEAFSPEYIMSVEGNGADVVPAMMDAFTFDHVFFTGGTVTGKAIYKMAAEKLVPVTLELGGKSPCIVEEDANIKVAGRRIAVTKFSNAGQMCVAPDYILVHESRRDALLQSLADSIRAFFTDKPEECYNYGRIINTRQFDRLKNLVDKGEIYYGGRSDRDDLFIEPTILTGVQPADPVMQEEIFGPILPVMTFREQEEALAIIRQHPNPLAFYVFTGSKEKEKSWTSRVQFGGGCINNASWHFTSHHLPIGGRGASGMGKYHGRFSFETFSHSKAMLRTPTWFDPAVKYPPFKGKLKLFKWVIK